MAKINMIKLIFLSSLIFQILSSEEAIYDQNKYIKDMKTSLWNSLKDGFYHIEDKILNKNHTVIAFADLDGDGYTDIVTYEKTGDDYTFYKYCYEKEEFKFKSPTELFKVTNSSISSVRNLFVGRLFGEEICYLASFNIKDDDSHLLHYISSKNDNTAKKMAISSNILILNRNENDEGQILFQDDNKKKKICILKSSDYLCQNGGKDFNYVNTLETKIPEENRGISLKGGLAYVDVDGNCSPDIILSYEHENKRHIEIYLSGREDKDKYYLVQDLLLGPDDEYGPFTISRIKNEKSQDTAPQFDILVPNLKTGQIIAFKNIIKEKYVWDDLYCKEDEFKDTKTKTTIFEKEKEYNLNLTDTDQQFKLVDSTTVIRPGDFLGSSQPGILVKQQVGNETVISLYEKGDDNFNLYLRIDKQKIGTPVLAVFFDFNEFGSLGLIIQNKEGDSHYFFNYRRNTFFIKAKLMNAKIERLYGDVNLGTSFRYIVTDKSGTRHMDLSYQMAQTSDMNIPLPYSLVGLADVNNYIENFQAISGNYYKDKDLFDDDKHRNFKEFTPIIPNTQMMISKYKETKYEWYIDLIVEPMEGLIVIVLSLLGVMLLIAGVIIYLHVREVKEEQKETNKFKYWFA